MSYTPTTWVNGQPPALNAENLNKIEQGIVKLDEDVDDVKKDLENYIFRTINTESGTYSDDGGMQKVANVARRRNPSLVDISHISNIYVPEGYGLWVFLFDENKSFISHAGEWLTGTIKTSASFKAETRYINFAVKDMSSATRDLTNVDISITFSNYEDSYDVSEKLRLLKYNGCKFNTVAGTNHSSLKDQILINIEAGKKYYYRIDTALTNVIDLFLLNNSDTLVSQVKATVGELSSFVAEANADKIGLYLENASATTSVEAIIAPEKSLLIKPEKNKIPLVMLAADGTFYCKITKEGVFKFLGNMYMYFPPFKNEYIAIASSSNQQSEFKFELNSGETLCLDVNACAKNMESNLASQVIVKRSYGDIPEGYMPIMNYRNGSGVFVYAPFLQFLEGDNNKFNSFEEAYYPYTHGNTGAGWYKRVNIMHIADTHVTAPSASGNFKEAISLANNMYANSVLSAMVNTGDMTLGAELTHSGMINDLNAYSKIATNIKVPYLAQTGNHDANDETDNSYQNATTKAEQWMYFYAPIKAKNSNVVWGDEGNSGYCYYDVSNVRIIMLDMLDHPDYNGSNTRYICQHTAVYSQKQVTWLCNALANIPSGYGVIICSHFPIAPQRTDYSEVYPALNDGIFAQGWKMIPEIVEAWQNRTSINKIYNDSVGTQNITVNANFSNVSATAQFICYLCGHTHSKNAFWVEEENGKHFNQRMLCEDSSGMVGTALNRAYKIFNTPIGNAFSCLSIDMKERKIYRTAYGAYKKCSDPSVQQTEVFDY